MTRPVSYMTLLGYFLSISMLMLFSAGRANADGGMLMDAHTDVITNIVFRMCTV